MTFILCDIFIDIICVVGYEMSDFIDDTPVISNRML
jgi:hypothetical protein